MAPQNTNLLDATWCAHNDGWHLLLELLLLLLHWQATEKVGDLHATHAGGEALKLVANLRVGLREYISRGYRLQEETGKGRGQKEKSKINTNLAHLEGQLAGVAQHDSGHLPGLGVELLQNGQDEHSGLAHAGLCLAQDVHAQNGVGDALVLHCGRGREDGGRGVRLGSRTGRLQPPRRY